MVAIYPKKTSFDSPNSPYGDAALSIITKLQFAHLCDRIKIVFFFWYPKPKILILHNILTPIFPPVISYILEEITNKFENSIFRIHLHAISIFKCYNCVITLLGVILAELDPNPLGLTWMHGHIIVTILVCMKVKFSFE